MKFNLIEVKNKLPDDDMFEDAERLKMKGNKISLRWIKSIRR
jgi:hypothetical protein